MKVSQLVHHEFHPYKAEKPLDRTFLGHHTTAPSHPHMLAICKKTFPQDLTLPPILPEGSICYRPKAWAEGMPPSVLPPISSLNLPPVNKKVENVKLPLYLPDPPTTIIASFSFLN